MNKMFLIARREYLEQIRGRGFRLSTIGLPALFAIIIGIGYFASLGMGGHKHLVIAANDPALAAQVRWAVSNPSTLDELGGRAHAIYEERYTPEVNFNRLIGIYRSVCRDRRLGAAEAVERKRSAHASGAV